MNVSTWEGRHEQCWTELRNKFPEELCAETVNSTKKLCAQIHAHRIDWLYIVIVSSLKFLFHKFIIKHWAGWTEHCLRHN